MRLIPDGCKKPINCLLPGTMFERDSIIALVTDRRDRNGSCEAFSIRCAGHVFRAWYNPETVVQPLKVEDSLSLHDTVCKLSKEIERLKEIVDKMEPDV